METAAAESWVGMCERQPQVTAIHGYRPVASLTPGRALALPPGSIRDRPAVPARSATQGTGPCAGDFSRPLRAN